MRKIMNVIIVLLMIMCLAQVSVSATKLPEYLGVWGIEGKKVVEFPARKRHQVISNWHGITKEIVSTAQVFSPDFKLFYYLYDSPRSIRLIKFKWHDLVKSKTGERWTLVEEYLADLEISLNIKPIQNRNNLFQLVHPVQFTAGVYLLVCDSSYYLFCIK